MGDPTSDADLLRAIAAGDEAALARAYDAHGGLVFALAQRVCRRPEEAEEVLQDVFLTLWRTADRFDAARGSLVAWLATMARNRAIDRLRARAARPDATAADVEPVAPAAATPSPADRAGHAEDAARARAALAALPNEERRALELAYFGGLSQTEIAATTGEPLGTVKGRTRNALSRLRGLLPRSLGGVA